MSPYCVAISIWGDDGNFENGWISEELVAAGRYSTVPSQVPSSIYVKTPSNYEKSGRMVGAYDNTKESSQPS